MSETDANQMISMTGATWSGSRGYGKQWRDSQAVSRALGPCAKRPAEDRALIKHRLIHRCRKSNSSNLLPRPKSRKGALLCKTSNPTVQPLVSSYKEPEIINPALTFHINQEAFRCGDSACFPLFAFAQEPSLQTFLVQ